MSTVRWREPIETGLDPIDRQHRELFQALDRLDEALRTPSSARVDEELAFMAQHTIRHCQTEETLMKDAAFPGRVAHADQHQELIREIRDLQYRRTRGLATDPEVVEVLGSWLEQHIQESDRAYADHLKGRRDA
jgi:hemerythrin-like metal-binding protein